jgi:hypothetical protein
MSPKLEPWNTDAAATALAYDLPQFSLLITPIEAQALADGVLPTRIINVCRDQLLKEIYPGELDWLRTDRAGVAPGMEPVQELCLQAPVELPASPWQRTPAPAAPAQTSATAPASPAGRRRRSSPSPLPPPPAPAPEPPLHTLPGANFPPPSSGRPASTEE